MKKTAKICRYAASDESRIGLIGALPRRNPSSGIGLIVLARQLLGSGHSHAGVGSKNQDRSMRIGIDNALGVHPEALALRGQRTQVLARNIANADTPGYQARDIDFSSVLRAATQTQTGLQTQRTHAAHLDPGQGSGNQAGIAADLKYRVPLMPSLDGNTVDVQMEQTTFAENSVQFMASLRFMNGKLNGLMTALKGE
jgi:flagellar basal-body rod protein FlgB